MYTVYSKDSCPYCEKAVALLEEKGLKYRVLKIPQQVNKSTVIDHVAALTGGSVSVETVPQIICNEKYIGGFAELQDLLE
ncbi:glutathione S-transferase N-terminal domain-containing protein [bacterium]|nr:glutathione S-transferase N-terminal domain-containing protein [bacterium]